MQRHELENLTREELIALAERLGVPRPRVLTQPEIMDEIVTRTARSSPDLARARGWFGRARDLLASVVERGLHLPEVARVLRATPASRSMPPPPPPLPTVTLAEIYAAQGHPDRAVAVLDEVLSREPDHEAARKLHARFSAQSARAKAPAARPAEVPATEPAVEPAATEDASAPLAAPVSIPEQEAVHEEARVLAVELSELEQPAEVTSPPLPARYNVDEVVAMAVDPTTVYFYWEVRPTTLARLRAAKPSGMLVARIVSVTATWQGPQADQRELRLDPLYGDHTERGIPSGAHVRVSVGWACGEDFDPIAIGTEVEVPRALVAESLSVHVGHWAPAPSRSPAGFADAYGIARYAFAANLTGMPLDRDRAVLQARGLSAGRPHTRVGPHPGGTPASGAPGLSSYGGASELSRGGSSELSRAP